MTHGAALLTFYREHRAAADRSLVPNVETDQSDVLLWKSRHLFGETLEQLCLFEGQVAVAQLALHERSEAARVLHHDVFRFGGVHRSRKLQC